MDPEELQQQILILQTEKTQLETQIEEYKINEETLKTSISEKDNKIEELRKFNNDLFLRVQQPQPQPQPPKNDNSTISDIINKLQ